MAPPTIPQILFSFFWLAFFIWAFRFLLRAFLGVRRLERRCELLERHLAAYARELNLDLPPPEPVRASVMARIKARVFPARRVQS